MIKYIINIFILFIFISCAQEGESSKTLFSGNQSPTVDTSDVTAATIDSISLPASATYNYEDIISIDIEFSETVGSIGSPSLEIDINGNLVDLPLVAGNNSSVFTFAKAIDIETIDNDGIEIVQLKGNGNDIVDAGLNVTDLDLSALSFDSSGILVDSIRPTINSLSINTGELFTNNTSATLNIDATNANEMLISLASDCSTETFEAYNTSKSLTLTDNSLNNYYVQFKSSAGSLSDCTNISITHDNLTPNSPAITLTLDASDIASDTSSWTTVSDNGPSGIDHYEFALSTTNTEAGIISGGEWVDIGLNLSHQIDSGITLSPATDYYTLVKAVDKAGNEIISASSAYQITVSPEVITNLEASNRTSDSITLGWSVPVDNGTPITDYEIEYYGGAIGSWTIFNDGVNNNTSASINALDAETEYNFRIRAFNGTNYSGWSNTLTVETLPNIDFFNGGYKAINISGAPNNQVVSMADGNVLQLDGSPLTTLNKGETYAFTASDFSVLEGTEPFYVAGKLGNGSIGGSNDQGNATWATSSWVGKEFLTILSRNAPLKLKVYAFTDSTITVYRGGALEDSISLTEGNGHTFSLASLGSYEIESTGFIVAFSYGNDGGLYYDPKPLLPSSKDIIGFPSASAKLGSKTNSNSVTYTHSNDNSGSITLNAGSLSTLNPQGTSNQYQSNAVRLRADENIIANSVADSDGYCSAPFVPVSMFKSKFATNVSTDYIAFASDRPVTITVTFPNASTSTITLTRSGSDPKAPYYARVSNYVAGVVFEGSDVFQAWYEPNTSTNAGDDDETVMFGWD
tara:strand:+ start:15710 stop:18121 length:2412 start_codon:yes stop_codon:yes gene_type:complete